MFELANSTIAGLAFPQSKEIHVWSVVAPELGADQLRSTLSPDELSRSEKFHFEPDRRSFINRRGILRVILASYLDTLPASVRFSYNAFGKPSIDGPVQVNNFRFNLSHSAQLLRIAVAINREVGIDVEVVDESVPIDSVASRVFAPRELAELKALPESLRRARFFSCWTRKEAYIKARGLGLSMPLDSIDLSAEPGRSAILVEEAGTNDVVHWRVENLESNAHYSTAIAAMGRDWQVLRLTLNYRNGAFEVAGI